MKDEFDQQQLFVADMLNALGIKYPSLSQLELMQSLLLRCMVLEPMEFNTQLSGEEFSYLYWRVKGKTGGEIAYLSRRKPSDIARNRTQILKKLHSETVSQAVVKGIQF